MCVSHTLNGTPLRGHVTIAIFFSAGPLMPGGPFITEIGTATQAVTSSKGWGGQIEAIGLQTATTGPPGAPLTKPLVSVA